MRSRTGLRLALPVVAGALISACQAPAPPGAAATSPAPAATHDAASPSPSPTPTPLALARTTWLGASVLAPTAWHRSTTVNGPEDGFVNLTAPGGYSVYLEVNPCAACVDQGLVQHGVANGIPYTAKVLAQYGAQSVHQLSPTRVTFTSRLYGTGPLLHDLLVVVDGQAVTGYVVLQVALPAADAADVPRIMDSLTVPASLGMGS